MSVTPNLQVDLAELLPALKSMNRILKASRKAEAVLSFEEETLRIELPGMSVGIVATGEWSGQARIPAAFLQMTARVPPTTTPVSFLVADGRLHINGSAVACAWDSNNASRIMLPLNPTFIMILSVVYHYTPDDIEKSGIENLVTEAKEQRDIKIGRALSALEEFGVTRAELRALVDEKMRGCPRP